MNSQEAKPRWVGHEPVPAFIEAHDYENTWRGRGPIAIRVEMEAALARWTPKQTRHKTEETNVS